ncbi:hypothetical protein [Plantibacter sp. Leaf314]|uniref:hypothetical protein n=1 Tax=Plantibacter sp. Leaf314 TaxID=1736333 RepID=UPI0006FE668B|nr:hypothetical protein [Plantibacter sp. Leaf314]KQQ52904.1 hypothetical protein ASF68_11655 [Plantibacter sp. Leaf314]
MRNRTALVGPSVIAVVLALAGCSPVHGAPSFASTKAEALALRDELAATLPAEDVLTTEPVENSIECDGSDTAQFDGTVTLTVDASFDRAAWLDEAAASYADRPGWRVQKKVDADGSSDATSGVSFFSDDAYYLRLDEFGDTADEEPAIVLSASGPCSVQ